VSIELGTDEALNQDLENRLVHELGQTIHTFWMVEAQTSSLTTCKNHNSCKTLFDESIALHIEQHHLLSG